jgi:hypothetical protein
MAGRIASYAVRELVMFPWMGEEDLPRASSVRFAMSGWLPAGAADYFGSGASLMVFPSRAD